MEEVTLLKLMFAIIAVLLLLANYLKDEVQCMTCYFMALILIIYSVFITQRLSNKNHTKHFKNLMIAIEVIFGLIALVGLFNCYMNWEKTITSKTAESVVNPKKTSAISNSSSEDKEVEEMLGGNKKVWAGIGTPTLF